MQGSCLCGSVTLTIPDAQHVHACHCGMCRRWGGGPLFAIECGQDVQVDGGQENIGTYRSSDWAERAFCRQCGTHLYYHLFGADAYFVAAGLFQAQTDLVLNEQIYIDAKPGYYTLADDTPVLTEAEVLAKYAV